MSRIRDNTDHLGSMRINASDADRRENGRTNVTHPWLNAENGSTIFISVAGNPDRREVWISAAGDDPNLGEEAVKNVHSSRSGEDRNEDDTVLSYTMI